MDDSSAGVGVRRRAAGRRHHRLGLGSGAGRWEFQLIGGLVVMLVLQLLFIRGGYAAKATAEALAR